MEGVFHVSVPDAATGKLVLKALAEYDLFQFNNKIKPDYCNAQGLECLDVEEDGEYDSSEDWVAYDEDDYFIGFVEACDDHFNFAAKTAKKYIPTLGDGIRFRNASTGDVIPAQSTISVDLDNLQIHIEDIEKFGGRLGDQREKHMTR